MKKYFHKKLIRDKIPQVIEASSFYQIDFKLVEEKQVKKKKRKRRIQEASFSYLVN